MRVLGESFAGIGAADYRLDITALPDSAEVRVLVEAVALTASEFELSYNAGELEFMEGAHGTWPREAGAADSEVDFSTPGKVIYRARLQQANPGAGASGTFELVSLNFAAHIHEGAGEPQTAYSTGALHALPSANLRPAGTSQISLPDSPVSRDWLLTYYLALPTPGSENGVYGDGQAARFASEVYELTNYMRTKKGLAPLAREPHLDAIAQAHALHMAREGYFEHVSPQGMDIFDRLDAAAPPHWRTSGENIAAGYSTPRYAIESWMDSKGHRRNIRNKNYDYVGIGVYHEPHSEYGWYWVQVFAGFASDPAIHNWLEPGAVPAG